MNKVMFCICSGLLLLTLRWADGAVPASQPSPAASQPASGDAGTDLVASFYKALLQPTPPTLAQETALFGDIPGIRRDLIARGVGTAKDAVVLQYFRKHKELFMPKNSESAEQLSMGISITSTFDWLRTLDANKEPPRKGNGSVMAAFFDDYKVPNTHLRSIVFTLTDGKLDWDIFLDGIRGRSVSDVMSDEFDPPGAPK